jgi:exonuclease SbcC
MYITRVELENIKSHVEVAFDFSRGTTAISGENGAGKTTLIEAIAWTLFDVLDYKKEDFLRRGSKRGSARVTFQSSLDDRLYTVYRDTGTGYNVYDPALKMRVADKKEEVSRFLLPHLGVEPGTDLDSLYRRAIGVPQGTFTAIFLETSAERKKAFDKLLKVEEYRRSAEDLLRTARFIDQQTAAVRETIARYEGELARIDVVEDAHKGVATQARELQLTRDQAESAIAEKKGDIEKFEAAEALSTEARVAFEKTESEQREAGFVLRQRERDLAQAREAAERIKEVKADYERHSSALLRLKELERERGEREKLRTELAKVEAALATVRADEKYIRESLADALKAHATISELKLPAQAQERLEGEVAKLRNAAAQAKALANQAKLLEERIVRLREDYRANTAKLNEAAEKTKIVDGLNDLEKRDSDIVRELASLHAALERDERFQQEIKDGLCPILSQKCLNLKEGETLDSFVTSQFTELRTRIAELDTEHGRISVALRTSREAEKFLSQVSLLQNRATEIKDEGQRLSDEKTRLDRDLEGLKNVDGDLAKAEAELKALGNPKGKMQLLEADANREGELRRKVSDIESNLERLESDRKIFTEQLESFKDFDSQWTQHTTIRDETSDANRTYLANEAMAKSVAQRAEEFESTKKELAAIDERLIRSRDAFEVAAKSYDGARHAVERAAFLELQKRQVEVSATLSAIRLRETELGAELTRLAEVRKSVLSEFKEKERLEKVSELTTFIRDTLKEAAPLVARNYVFHVSVEANQLYREITGNAEQTLKWGEDYAISLEEDGYDRPFQSLSGGEQMAAALAVRLALLKQLTDLRLAFFDEPTSNLDYERRENLAMQISQIKHFDQLFVISHDDTFEGYVDNVVTIERGAHDAPQQLELSA